MARLPMDVMFDILTLLPVKSLHRFKCVCKSWYKLINSSDFINSHLNYSLQTNSKISLIFTTDIIYSSIINLVPVNNISSPTTQFNLPPVLEKKTIKNVIGSCNGLICIKLSDGIALCNLSTRAFKLVPTVSAPCHITGVQYGFGYDNHGDDYKILKSTSRETYLYSLRANAWKRVESLCYGISGNKNYVFVNNRLHYLDHDETVSYVHGFDLHDERWERIPLAEDISNSECSKMLGRFDGCLCLTTLSPNCYNGHKRIDHDIWVMKKYGVRDSWVNLFSFSSPIKIFPLAYSKGYKEVICRGMQDKRFLFRYDVFQETIKEIKIVNESFDPSSIEDHLYVESLTPLVTNSDRCKQLQQEIRNRRNGKSLVSLFNLYGNKKKIKYSS